MPENLRPNKIERRALFRTADFAARLMVRDITEVDRKGKHLPRWQKVMNQELATEHSSLPFVLAQLILPEVQKMRDDPSQPIHIEGLIDRYHINDVAIGSLILATGLDRNVVVAIKDDFRTVTADDHPEKVQFQFTVAAAH